jgi:hypothetical protein
VAESAGIQDVQERVRDFALALRSAGAVDVAQRIERYALGFVRTAEVRRSVAAIQEQLRYFRTYPDELPDLPIVQVAANRLEDVCKAALAGGLIEPAKLSLRAASKRKLGVIATTLAAAGLCFVLPLLLTMFGVDWDDLLKKRELAPAAVAQGEEIQLSVTALEASPELAVTKGVEFYVRGHCATDLGSGMHCKHAEPRELGGALRPSYEITLDDQVYGLFVGFGDTQMLGAVGNGAVWVAATWDTPEGRYQLPLQAAFLGYTPERCNWLDRALERCTSRRVGADAKYEDLAVPMLVVDVVKGDPRKPAEHMKQKKLEEERLRSEAAARRAAELAKNVGQIKAVLDDTQAMARKQQWAAVRERAAKLTQLFAPLDQLVVGGGEGEPLPAEVASLRTRFEGLRRELQVFEDRAFDAAYATIRDARAKPAAAESSQSKPVAATSALAAKSSDETAAASATESDARLGALANKLHITPAYMDEIIAAHAEQYEARIAQEEAVRRAKAQAEQAGLLQRCGPLPTHAFNEVRGYLNAMGNSVRIKTRLNECLTPRLTDKLCWSVVCTFDELIPGELTDTSHQRRWTFLLRNGRVVDHLDKAID